MRVRLPDLVIMRVRLSDVVIQRLLIGGSQWEAPQAETGPIRVAQTVSDRRSLSRRRWRASRGTLQYIYDIFFDLIPVKGFSTDRVLNRFRTAWTENSPKLWMSSKIVGMISEV